MDNYRLVDYLSANANIERDVILEVVSDQKTISVSKGEYLLMPGEVCRSSFFVEEGLLRYYSIDAKGKEHILQFAPENWFMADRESAYFGKPSQYFIQALEDSTIVTLNENFILRLSAKHPAFIEFNNRLLHNHIRHLQNRVNQLLSYTAEERYLKFIELYPNVLLRVPQTMVASYLGITPESLSRVRKELSKKHFGK